MHTSGIYHSVCVVYRQLGLGIRGVCMHRYGEYLTSILLFLRLQREEGLDVYSLFDRDIMDKSQHLMCRDH